MFTTKIIQYYFYYRNVCTKKCAINIHIYEFSEFDE